MFELIPGQPGLGRSSVIKWKLAGIFAVRVVGVQVALHNVEGVPASDPFKQETIADNGTEMNQ